MVKYLDSMSDFLTKLLKLGFMSLTALRGTVVAESVVLGFYLRSQWYLHHKSLFLTISIVSTTFMLAPSTFFQDLIINVIMSFQNKSIVSVALTLVTNLLHTFFLTTPLSNAYVACLNQQE